jgi:hypothetical protein
VAIWALPDFNARDLTDAAKATGPSLLFGLRLWAWVCLALYVAFWLELDNPSRQSSLGRHGGPRLPTAAGASLASVAQGNSAAATVRLAQVDQALAFRASIGAQTQAVLRARSRILALSETLTEYASYFDGGARTFPLTKQGLSFPGKR